MILSTCDRRWFLNIEVAGPGNHTEDTVTADAGRYGNGLTKRSALHRQRTLLTGSRETESNRRRERRIAMVTSSECSFRASLE